MKYAHAWAAGFFDGEGCVTLSKRNRSIRMLSPSYELRISITQRTARPLHRFRGIYGGSVRHDAARNLYHYVATGPTAAHALQSMLEFLTVKEAQAKLALEFQKTKTKMGDTSGLSDSVLQYREEVYQRLKIMKREWND